MKKLLKFFSSKSKAQTEPEAEDEGFEFAGQCFFEAYSTENPETKQLMIEYLPKGESLDSFTHMFSYYELPHVEAEHLENMVISLTQDTESPIYSKCLAAFKDEELNEYVITKVASQNQVTEYVVYRFMVKNGYIVYYFYSYRTYEEDVEAWLNGALDQQDSLITEIAALPKV